MSRARRGAKPVVRTKLLTKAFGNLVALDSVTLECPEGITAVLGPNGAGKSTMIKMLLGLLRPTSGTATVLGRDCRKMSKEIRRRVGVLHEKPALPRSFTAEQFLRLVCEYYQLTGVSDKIRDILQAVDLWEHRDRRIGHYSAGMVQRLGLAQALVPEPRLAILDEPMANLDPLSRLRALEIIGKAWKERKTSFLILSHDLLYLERVCSYAIFLREGRMLASGRLSDLLRRGKRTFVTVACEDGDDAYGAVGELPSVESVERSGTLIRCEVRNPKRFQEELFHLALNRDIVIKTFQVQHDNLEQLYVRIIGGEAEGR